MSKDAIPKSKAKTAYDLLSEIAELALEEPKRMAMAEWLVSANDIKFNYLARPACNAVGCIGGWTETLVPRRGPSEVILGLADEQATELFFDKELVSAPNQQTPAHARAVVRHIRKFQKKYATQLKAKKLDRVTR